LRNSSSISWKGRGGKKTLLKQEKKERRRVRERCLPAGKTTKGAVYCPGVLRGKGGGGASFLLDEGLLTLIQGKGVRKLGEGRLHIRKVPERLEEGHLGGGRNYQGQRLPSIIFRLSSVIENRKGDRSKHFLEREKKGVINQLKEAASQHLVRVERTSCSWGKGRLSMKKEKRGGGRCVLRRHPFF